MCFGDSSTRYPRLILKLTDLRALKYGWEIVPSERFIFVSSEEELYVGKGKGTLFRAHIYISEDVDPLRMDCCIWRYWTPHALWYSDIPKREKKNLITKEGARPLLWKQLININQYHDCIIILNLDRFHLSHNLKEYQKQNIVHENFVIKSHSKINYLSNK